MDVQFKLEEIYEWWAREINKPVDEFDDAERKLAMEAYLANLKKAVSGSEVKNNKADLKKKRGREIRKGRRGRRPF
ncbi:unnamed protein product [marine sediment metagenome]|uniref:Uncharacterized protein n=1 Tax=marine sediment metagenome TaxID=412755 RepID=X0SZF6_9ZZZZ